MSVEDCLKGNQIKHEATVNLDTLKKFREVHDAHIIKKSPGPCGQDYSFKYIPSSIGVFVRIECMCGAERDITDYERM